MPLQFSMDYPPSINHYYVRTKKGMAVGKPGKLYRHAAIIKLHPFKNHFSKDKRVAIVINVYPPDRRKRDLDNILKCCLDSLQHAGIFEDDNQIDLLTVIRRDPIKGGGISVRLTECS